MKSVPHAQKPPTKKKLNFSQKKKKNRPEHDAMVTLAAQLQVDHFRQVNQSARDLIKA